MEMKITLEQVKQDIADRKCKRIVYSSRTCWWSHLEEDLIEATAAGKAASEIGFKRMMEDPKITEEVKKKYESLKRTIEKAENQTPLDPTGAPLFESLNPGNWIADAEQKKEKFGRHGLDALMLAHHQNSAGGAFQTWESYNKVIDIENQTAKL